MFVRSPQFRFATALVAVSLLPMAVVRAAELDAETKTLAKEILSETGVQGGLVVHLGAGDGKLTAALKANDSFQVHGLDRDSANVNDAREFVQSLGIYGTVSVDRLTGDALPYVANMVNLIVAEDAAGIADDELLRVLVPNGVAYVKRDGRWTKTVKPQPENIDEWTHFLHNAGGNAVAHDKVVGPPKHLQWLGSPRWSRHHDRMASMSALVSAGGRIFYIMDEGSRISIQMPPKWTLIARDAFNGVILWKRPIAKWQHHLWPLKSGPTQLARRLVAVGDRVYVTLGFTAPLTELDAATGKIIRTFDTTDGTEEVIVTDKAVLALVNDGISELADYVPAHNVGDQRRVASEFIWNKQPRRVTAFDKESGAKLWEQESLVAPLTLSADADRVYFHDGEKVVCVDRVTGDEQWHSEPAGRRASITFNFGPKLVVTQGLVLFAGGDRTMRALDAKSGKQIWEAPHARGGYQSPEDLLVVNGMVWSAPTTSGRDSGVFTGRDLQTGEVKVEFPPNVETYWFHHRCYIAKATDNYILPSRTGIEFVDFKKQNWDINHWVRGGCLYGVMPCNGLTYAPPHDCACYPEAKLYGMNALAPASASRQLPEEISAKDRLEKGPAFKSIEREKVNPGDWPTYRGNSSRTGFTKTSVPSDLKKRWQVDLGGRLTTPTVASGRVYVAQVDQHTLHVLDEATGEKLWRFTAGGRVDSPPTIHGGRVLFGSADGWVYCLRAADGKLAWRFRAAPRDNRLMSLEQLESVWPVHGSVLVKNNTVYCVAGRSNFLDGGLRFIRLNGSSGELISETIIDDRDPVTGEDIQDRLQTLQMPVGLPDILSTDGQNIYMRSQQFDLEGNRIAVGPHSGNAPVQGAVQSGSTAHLFAPMGYLDDTYFHRAYWVYGRSFAGGHNGYYQAGKFTPSGRILVSDNKNVYGFGRKPQYYRWTTTIEHQLFSASKEPPPQALSEAGTSVLSQGARRGSGASMIDVNNSKSLNPAGKPLTVEAWVKAEKPNGVVVAHGGPANGYALVLQNGKPQFMVRSQEKLSSVGIDKRLVNQWTHLCGILTPEKQLKLYVNGKLAATGKATGLVAAEPQQALQVGADEGSAVGNYKSPHALTGVIDEVRIFHRALTDAEAAARHADGTSLNTDTALVLAFSFDKGRATDASGNANRGKINRVTAVEGKIAGAMKFTGGGKGGGNAQASGSFVKPNWTTDIPLYARAMVLADKTLFVAGPPDLIDEEETFAKIMSRDPEVQAKLAEQDKALDGSQGGKLWIVNSTDGTKLAELKLDALPIWDGIAAANGRLFVTLTDGRVLCLAH